MLLCTKCYAVHKPGQLTPTMATRNPCEGASRAHAKRWSLWVQKYLKETTAPVALFAAGGRAGQTLEVSKAEPTPDSPAQSRPIGEPVASSQTEPKTGCGLHTWTTAEKANTQAAPRDGQSYHRPNNRLRHRSPMHCRLDALPLA